jgi:hypothetical protein
MFGYGVPLMAQNAIPATGGNASGTGGTVSYTIGEVVYTTNTGNNGSVAQGIQQAYEISVVTALENTEGITLEYKVYPNPTRGKITLTITPFETDNIRFRFFDQNGILLQEKKIESEITEISMENLNPSMYFLQVIKDNREVKVFKIIKTDHI